MSSDFMESILKEINSKMDKLSSTVTEMFEVSKVKNQINELAQIRKDKLAELGSLTFRKIEDLEVIKAEEVNKIVEEVKKLNDQINAKKDELEENIKDAEKKTEKIEKADSSFCPNCGNKNQPQDKFCRNCGNKAILE